MTHKGDEEATNISVPIMRSFQGETGQAGALEFEKERGLVSMTIGDEKWSGETFVAGLKQGGRLASAFALALGMVRDERIADMLFDLLQNETEDIEVRSHAAVILGQMGDVRVIELLLKTLINGDVQLRIASARSLGFFLHKNSLHSKHLIEPLIHALSDEDSDVRKFAMLALHLQADLDILMPLIEGLKDSNAKVREFAASGLGKINDEHGIEPLISALHDKDRSVRRAAANALGDLGDKRALKPLLEAFLEDIYPVYATAQTSLQKLRDPQLVEPLIEALKNEKAWVRQGSADLLGELDDRRAVDPLLKALSVEPVLDTEELSDTDLFFKSASRALARLKDSSAYEPIVAGLTNQKAFVRACAASSLGELGDTRAVEFLIATLQDEDADVRDSSIYALGKLGDVELLPVLEYVQQTDIGETAYGDLVKDSATRAIERIQGRQAGEKVEALEEKIG